MRTSRIWEALVSVPLLVAVLFEEFRVEMLDGYVWFMGVSDQSRFL